VRLPARLLDGKMDIKKETNPVSLEKQYHAHFNWLHCNVILSAAFVHEAFTYMKLNYPILRHKVLKHFN
jgi:hypothetical protein